MLLFTGAHNASEGQLLSVSKYLSGFIRHPKVRYKHEKMIDPADVLVLKSNHYHHHPHHEKYDLRAFFKDQSLYYEDKTFIGMAYAHNWIWNSIYKTIDDGSVYVSRNPVKGKSEPPNLSTEEIRKTYKLNEELIKDSFLATKHPKFIRDLAKKFIQDYMGIKNYKKFVAVHFRFNPGDFFDREFMGEADGSTHKYYRGIDPYTANHLRRTLHDTKYLLDHLVKKMDQHPWNHAGKINKVIYIASPRNVAGSFPVHNGQTYGGYQIFNTLDITEFLDSYREDCWVYEHYYGDILSTLEKEMMVISKIFYRSRPSNWSFNEQGHRFAEEPAEEIAEDRVVFDIFNR